MEYVPDNNDLYDMYEAEELRLERLKEKEEWFEQEMDRWEDEDEY